jgi:hypothetical protein
MQAMKELQQTPGGRGLGLRDSLGPQPGSRGSRPSVVYDADLSSRTLRKTKELRRSR